MDFFPKVLQTVPADGYKVFAYMNDGTVRCFDAEPLIEKGGVFDPFTVYAMPLIADPAG